MLLDELVLVWDLHQCVQCELFWASVVLSKDFMEINKLELIHVRT